MPRKYEKKRPRPTYTTEDITLAVTDVMNRNSTYRKASETYGVPISVIFHRIKGRKVPMNKRGNGRNAALPSEIETQIKNCLKARARMGYPCNRQELQSLVGEYVKTNNLKTPFKDDTPGPDWYYSFMSRHPDLSFKKPEHLQKNRKEARKPYIIYNFYDQLKKVLKGSDLWDNKESLIFNCDESGFPNDPSRLKAIGEKGKALSRVSGGSGRESTTVLACISADGCFLPPMIVYKGVAVQARWISKSSYPGTLYSCSTNGWMEEPQFHQWFQDCFVPHVTKLREDKGIPDQKALLLFDGHASHISLRIIESALHHKIELVKFPSHLTDKLQPLDKTVFGPIKTAWEKKLIAFGKTQVGKGSGRLPKNEFAKLLGEVWVEGMKPENITAGFISTGIYPYNPSKFPTSEFDPRELEFYTKEIGRKNRIGPANEETTSSTPVELVSDPKTLLPSTSNYAPLLAEQLLESNATSSLDETTLPLDLSNHMPNCFQFTPTKSQKESQTPSSTPRKIIDIFSSNLVKLNRQLQAEFSNSNKDVKNTNTRLKCAKYGEVLTTADVIQRLKEAQEKKIRKGAKPKEARPKNKKQGKKRSRKFSISDDSDENVVQEMEKEDKGEQDTYKNWVEEIETQNCPEVNYLQPQWSDINPGVFILAEFLGGPRKTTHYKYVCCVKEVDDDEGDIVVTGLKREDVLATKFRMEEKDVSAISFEMVRAILPDPQIEKEKRKTLYVFPGTVNVYEK